MFQTHLWILAPILQAIKLLKSDNITIFMNDRFLADFNNNLVSKYFVKDLSTLTWLNSPVLYGNIGYHGGLTQSSAVSNISYFIPTYFFVINSNRMSYFKIDLVRLKN